MQAVVDRFEGEKAVLLVGGTEQKVVFPREYLPEDIGEGDYLQIEIRYDEDATLAARREAEALLRALE